MAMAQITPGAGPDSAATDWFWQPLTATESSPTVSHSVFDPEALRQARQRSGFQARSLAMAIPQAQLQSYQFQFDSRLNLRQLQAQVREQLQAVLPWPLADAVWDFQVTPPAGEPVAAKPSGRPAWLDQALQAQPVQQVDVLAVPRAWAQSCEDACRQAGLQLLRLEPAWQASQRWQAYTQQQRNGVLQENTAMYGQVMSEDLQAVAGGLALGVVMA